MNDLSSALSQTNARRCCNPIPTPVFCILTPLFFVSLALSIFIFVAVGNAVLLISLLLISSLISAFLFWNVCIWKRDGGILLFLDHLPDADLRTAKDGQLVKITGLASCGTISLESSYEKVPRCVYISTLVYEYIGFRSELANINQRYFQWSLTYSERFATDFYITDTKSGIRAMVKAGYDSKVTPLIHETRLVSTTRRNRALSSYLRKWLGERNLSAEARLLRLEEGYVKEGSSLTVMGVLQRNNDDVMIVQLPEPISTGCLWRRFLLPGDINGLILRVSDSTASLATPCSLQDPGR
ncbi:uncharacterized membrane protein At1g16860-like [Magnolia sinica]|uniref:uncharacterized membrane protein At1g16860-like n=1 Tax=Magnolia sinica TaxID=86752 RepID=UPI00265A58A9|nr:uncharacterized membrane protein At1g16860-like [Magnolia sinica]